MELIDENRIISFFDKAYNKFKEKKYLSNSDLEYLLFSSIELLSINYPNQIILKYFIQPEIVKLFLFELNNSGLKLADDRFKIQKPLSDIVKKLHPKTKKRFLKFRILDKYGYYPNCDLYRNGIHYSNVNHIPTLLTKNSYSSEELYTNFSEVLWVTRKELQAATCIFLAPSYGKPILYFSDFNHIELNEETLKIVPKDLHGYFMLELVQFQNRFKPLNGIYLERERLHDVSAYNFFDFEGSKSIFYQLLDSYSIRNHLLLRTSNYLIKASMLWENRTFGEEAIVNVFFALEGCLHLLQKKFGDNSTKLNRKLLKKIFKEHIPYGENLYNFIEDGYYTRISLVHAEPDWGAEWSPFIAAEDFFEYRNICRELLNFILINRVID